MAQPARGRAGVAALRGAHRIAGQVLPALQTGDRMNLDRFQPPATSEQLAAERETERLY
jgi:hypothetical protein